MKIKEITLKNFGKYIDVETPLVFKDGVNVVYGVNEAGKSTLFNGLLTLLYGYKPANREAHPYLGWGANKMEVVGRFEDADGEFQIERKLMSSVTGKVIRGRQEQKINNKPLDVLQNISRPTYESIYALTLHDVIQMGDKPWSEVEDRLILNYGMASVLSPREVLQLLDADLKKIFNPRGQAKNTRVKVLEKEIKALKKERTTILDNQEVVTEKEAALKRTQDELDDLLKREAVIRKDLQWWEKHEKIIELTQGLDEIAKLKQPLEEVLDQLPEDARRIEDLGTDLEKATAKLESLKEEKAMHDKALKPLTELENKCLASEAKVRPLLNRWRKYQSDKALQESKREALLDKRNQLTHLLSDIMASPSQEAIRVLSALNIMSLEGKLETVDRLKLENENLKSEIYARRASPQKSSIGLAIGIAILGVLIFAGGLYLSQDMMKYGAVLLLSYGGFKMMSAKQDVQAEDIAVFQDKINFNQQGIAEAIDGVALELSQLSISTDQIQTAGQRLLGVLKQAKALAQVLESSEEAFQNTFDAIKAEGNEIIHELLSLGIVESEKTVDDQFIEGTISSAIEKRNDNVEIKTKSDLLAKRIEETKAQASNMGEKYNTLKDYFLKVGEGELATGLGKLDALDRFTAKERLLLEQLDEKDPGHSMRQAMDKLSEQDMDVSHKKIELRELTESISDKKVAIRGMETEIKHLLEGVDLFDVESQLSALSEELEEAKVAYDKLLSLRTIVAAYDQSYREEHQPDIHKRTGHYFEKITNSKYSKVYNDELVGKTALMVRQGDEERAAEEALSQGTRDQLYLALRLALADELDKDKTIMPLFLDELFVNWDMPRLEEGLSLMNDIAAKRQVVLLTCHEWMVDKIQACCKAHVITLEG